MSGRTDLPDSVLADPRRALADAGRALAEARRAHDDSGQAVALRVLGLAAHNLADPAAAAGHLRAAVRAARRGGDTVAEGEARMSLALVLDDLGRTAAALREADRACQQLHGLRRGRATMQRALILRRAGRDTEALDGYRRALATFRRHGDEAWQARALTNRGALHSLHGRLAAARGDLSEAADIFARLGLVTALATVQHNIGHVAAQGGDVRTALEYYDRSRTQLSVVGAVAAPQQNRAEVLLDARLLPEARVAVAEAIRAARAGRLSGQLGQAQLMSARIELAAGAPAAARPLAALARATFRRQGRGTWAAYARRFEVMARVGAGRPDRRAVRALEEAGDEMAAAGWSLRAWDAWLDATHLALDVDDRPAARRLLAKAAPARGAGPAPMRARAWHAAARLDLAAGRVTAAKRRADAGYREIERHRASLGATELAVRGGAAGTAIAALRLRLAVDEGDAAGALRWVQRARCASLRLPSARLPDDPVVADRLTELRAIVAQLSTLDAASGPALRLLRRQRAVEAEIRQRSWRVTGAAAPTAGRPPTVAELAAALDDRVLVELFALDGRLHAVVLAAGRTVLHRLGPVTEAESELAALRFAVRRQLAHPPGTPAAARAAGGVALSVGRLDRMLLGPLAAHLGDRPLLLSPTGALHALPWSILPSCQGRPVTVSPSSWLWWQADRSPRPARDTVLIAGPAPSHVAAEVDALAARLPAATVLTGVDATVSATLRALDGAALGHVATHGVFRADNPLFSHLTLVDGPLTMCDLSGLRRPPDLLVLASCDAALSAVHAGDELQGLAVALLGLGTRTVIASLGLVDDATTKNLMLTLYAELAAGSPPSVALATAQAAAAPTDPVGAANFVCMGIG